MAISMISTSCLAITSVFVVLATVAVGLRIWARKTKFLVLEADDYVVQAALVFCYGLLIITIVCGSIGGVNEAVMDPLSSAEWFVKILWVEPFLVTPALALVKISILLFYKRIFVTPSFRLACDVMIGIVSAWGATNLIAQLNMAHPIYQVWNVMGNFVTWDYSSFALATAGISIGLDVITLCLPLPVIGKLQMKRNQKLMTAGIFWLGIFCVIAGSLRFYYGYVEVNLSINSNGDTRYAVVTQVYLWDRIEPCASIIAACLPTYGPLVRGNRLLESWIKSAASFFSMRSSSRSSRPKKSTTDVSSTTDTEALRSKSAWERLSGHNGVGFTAISNDELELESQTRLKSYPAQVHVTSTVDLDFERA
ncbi:hypothetical protein MMC30_002936 [Trapelia coarctata]|nr:hypothetical protein [Trapelia coarctata]